jgi:hypothetical protein
MDANVGKILVFGAVSCCIAEACDKLKHFITMCETSIMMKLYNYQRNAQSPGYGVSTWALTPYPADLNNCRSCTPASEDGLKESPKHVRQR